ncbi:phenoloxidase-activating factor 2-like [Contarinia nasturtii]|uniref:phenoloxidase-activating factor 2-like n=1 Tax=Contarinia nasturtii TaxID=265458 RepID=UPI0012D47FFD|nr:phenoloxidase-activating factor 2-like [Contarinia nasturtii]
MLRFINVLLLSLLSNGWLPIVNAQMVFPEPVMANGSQLSRSGFPLLSAFPIYNPFQAVVPGQLVTPPTYAGAVQTCICVPTGQCTGTIVPSTPVDGSGLIDIRIVNNPTPSPAVPTAPCYAGLQRCCFSGPYRCGVRYPPVAGSPAAGPGQAQYGKYPWQAVLLGTGDVYQGSGVLIDALNVLTVAHKVANYSAVPNQLRVRMGEWNAAGDTEPLPAQEFVVSKIFVHPSFNPTNLMNDVAILRLTVAVPLGQLPTITTACLPISSYVGTRCWVSGWGKNDFNGVYQTIQKEVDVPILDAAKCQSALAATRLGSAFVFDGNSFICAGGEQGKDACTGDGGSPLVCELNGQNFVAGLSAWGIGCATSNVPGVYVNIKTYTPFIQSSIQSS